MSWVSVRPELVSVFAAVAVVYFFQICALEQKSDDEAKMDCVSGSTIQTNEISVLVIITTDDINRAPMIVDSQCLKCHSASDHVYNIQH